jgi:copper oxidase (laccase) domain-containing protein
MEALGAQRPRIIAAIGPLIRQASYEVDDAFVARFAQADAEYRRFFVPGERAHHAMFDLPGFIAHRCEAVGIGTIEDLQLDTYADEQRFFSYRRSVHRSEPDYGRLLAAIALGG